MVGPVSSSSSMSSSSLICLHRGMMYSFLVSLAARISAWVIRENLRARAASATRLTRCAVFWRLARAMACCISIFLICSLNSGVDSSTFLRMGAFLFACFSFSAILCALALAAVVVGNVMDTFFTTTASSSTHSPLAQANLYSYHSALASLIFLFFSISIIFSCTSRVSSWISSKRSCANIFSIARRSSNCRRSISSRLISSKIEAMCICTCLSDIFHRLEGGFSGTTDRDS